MRGWEGFPEDQQPPHLSTGDKLLFILLVLTIGFWIVLHQVEKAGTVLAVPPTLETR